MSKQRKLYKKAYERAKKMEYMTQQVSLFIKKRK